MKTQIMIYAGVRECIEHLLKTALTERGNLTYHLHLVEAKIEAFQQALDAIPPDSPVQAEPEND